MKLRTAICVLIVYLLTVGATFTGIVEPPLRLLTTLILSVCVLLWLTGRRGQVWSVPPLAGVILVWIAAVALSLIGNLDSARRILIGVWFAGAYIGAWFALHDLLVTGRLRRADLINALLIAGGLIAISGYVEFIVVYFQRADFVRPGGLMGNPNSLAALLVIAIPFALSRIAATRSVMRVVMAIYTLAALALLGLTFSRGGWLGIVPILTYTAYLAYLWLRRTWGRFSLLVRLAVIGSGLLGALVIAVSALVLIDSFGDATRSVDLRTWIYATAVRAFAAQPITGSGLFTFGADLARYNSMPFYEPHNHAHNAVLHVAAELGVVGLIALALTAGWLIVGARRGWRSGADRLTLIGAVGALAGFGVHHLLDFPAIMPSIALAALLAGVVLSIERQFNATPPPTPPRIQGGEKTAPLQPLVSQFSAAQSEHTGQPVLLISTDQTEQKNERQSLSFSPPRIRGGAGVGLLWLALLVAALWSAVSSWSYTNTLNAALRSGDYYAGAVGLQAVIDADPLLATYSQQQGMLYAFDALTDPARSTTPAIEAFRRAADLAPEYTANWANLGALYASISEYQSAALALRRAMQLAPDDPFFGYTAARYAELSGDFESARAWYTEAVTRYPDLVMLPDWDESAIRREIALSAPPLSDLGQVIRLIEAGDPAAARAIWTGSVWNGTSSRDAVIDYLISQAAGQDEAMRWLIIAQNAAVTPLDQAWVHYGRFAAYGDSAELDAARDAAYLTALQADLTGVDWANGANISYGQYLRMALPRQFVPQLGWTPAEPALLYLLGDS